MHLSFLLTIFSFFYSLVLAAPAPAIKPGFSYGSQKVRGVNIGGWLVLEPWVTPSLFDNTSDSRVIDEYTFGQYVPKSKAQAALKKHWDTWITESDFSAIKNAGLNHVRIPIGYWAWDISAGEPYIQGQLPYLQKAVGWAAKYGLKVIVDLHGAPGSQNGFDNSGQKKSFPGWHSSASNIRRTNEVIKKIANLFKDNSNVVPIIAALNEPAGFYGTAILNAVRQFWFDSYGNIRFPYGSSKQSNTIVMLSDAFQPQTYWKNFMPPPNYQGVMMDTHIYQVFSDGENQRTDKQHLQNTCSRNDLLGSGLWTVVGEWTPAMTDCAKYLNGRGIGARYDGTFPGSQKIGSCTGKTGKASTFSAAFKKTLRQNWEAQVQTYEKANGWIQWTWKAEIADEWSYQAGLKNGWIPSNPTAYQFPNICNTL